MIKTIFNGSLYAFDLEKHFTIEQCVLIARKTKAEFKSNQGGYHSSNLKDKIIKVAKIHCYKWFHTCACQEGYFTLSK